MEKRKNKIEVIPIINECTYYHKDKHGICKNCKNTRKYKDGYYLIVNGYAYSVDTIK